MTEQIKTIGRCHCGAVTWTFSGEIADATICNCTACRRYGVLWAYDFEDQAIHVEAPENGLTSYLGATGTLTFNFCRTCGNLVSWRATRPQAAGRTRIAVNLRLAEPDGVANLPLLRFDGLHNFEDLPTLGRHIADVWF